MRNEDSVQVEVGMVGNHLILNIPFKNYKNLEDSIESSPTDWVQVSLDDGAKVRIKASSVQYLRLKPAGVRQLKKREGVPLKEIAEALGESYDYFRQKIKRQGILLDKSSERRVLLTEENIKLLGLTEKMIDKLLKK